jgi:diguanylate cyclase
MEHDGLKVSQEWQQKYLTLRSEVELMEKMSAAKVSQLRQGMSRLSIAAQGIHPQLDQHLSSLRNAIRQGQDHEHVITYVEEIAKVLKHLDNLNLHKAPAANDQAPTVAHAKTSSAAGATPPSTAAGGSSSPSNPNAPAGVKMTPQAVINCLKELLDHLAVPKELEVTATTIGQKLIKGFPINELISVLEGFKDLVIDAFKIEQKKLGSYLEALQTQLAGVQSFLTDSNSDSKETLSDNVNLNHSVRDQVCNIQQSIQAANSLETLSSNIESSLKNIISCVDEHQKRAEERAELAKAKIEHLETELTSTQTIADNLRESLTEQVYLAQRDALTGLLNRKAYDEQIKKHYARWQRNKDGLVMIVADIDKFKHINDTYGHLAGDKVLEKVAGVLGKSFRQYDTVARYGGEEFVIVMEQISVPDAKNAANKVRELIEKSNFHFRNSPVPVTVSFGIAEFKEGDVPADVFGRADAALYKAKDNGRNQVVCSE